jgi:hypothetical protein
MRAQASNLGPVPLLVRAVRMEIGRAVFQGPDSFRICAVATPGIDAFPASRGELREVFPQAARSGALLHPDRRAVAFSVGTTGSFLGRDLLGGRPHREREKRE